MTSAESARLAVEAPAAAARENQWRQQRQQQQSRSQSAQPEASNGRCFLCILYHISRFEGRPVLNRYPLYTRMELFYVVNLTRFLHIWSFTLEKKPINIENINVLFSLFQNLPLMPTWSPAPPRQGAPEARGQQPVIVKDMRTSLHR